MKGLYLIHGYNNPAYQVRREKGTFFFSLIICFSMLLALPGQISFTAAESTQQETRDSRAYPPIAEVYYLSWPESQMMTAFGSIFRSGQTSPGDTAACTTSGDYSPVEPVISYSSITITESGTYIFYDHYEDGYNPVLNNPIQATTEIWGDGVLGNGAAPGDADDLLVAGQILILRSIKNSTDTPDVTYDYDGRDKIGASFPVSVTRSSWATGSATNFVAGDQLKPTSQWGTSFIVPIGEQPGYTDIFQYTGAVAMAKEDGTTVSFDRNHDGTPELTCNLNEGESCQWDDASFATGIMGAYNVIGNGLIPGSTIWSNKPIQVHLLTGDVCAYYESRSYTLSPTTQWSDRYGSPVSTGNGSDGYLAPTTVHLFNPDPINAIYVAYQCYGGTPGTLTTPVAIIVPAYSGVHYNQPDDIGCRYYSATVDGSMITNNVRDQFNIVAYNNNNGSVNWATNWGEVNEGDGPANGDVLITGGELRIGQDDNAGIYRSANLSGVSSATLTFSFRETGSGTGDVLTIQASTTPTGGWVNLGTIDGSQTSGTRSYNLNPYISTTTAIRFIITSAWEDNEFVYLDNVDITYYNFPTATGQSFKPFSALVSVDTDGEGSAFDWGYSLVPFGNVSPWLMVGYAPGMDPEYTGTEPDQNSAPVWVIGGHVNNFNDTTAFTVCVDYDGDNVAGTQDPITLKYYDTTYTLTTLQEQMIYDPDGDQTGMQIWVCGYDPAVGSDVVLTGAWGEDPSIASTGSPAVDMGFSIRNMRAWLALKAVGFAPGGDLGQAGAYNEGDTIRYTITVPNRGAVISANTLNVTDALPPEVAYVPGSTYYIDHLGVTTAIPDTGTTPFPLDESGFTYPLALPATKSFKVYFDATIKVNGIIFPYDILNVATVTDAFHTEFPEAEVEVYNEPTAITIPSDPESELSDAIHVTWGTFSELQLVGFKLYREVNHAGVLSQLSVINAYTPDMLIGNDYDYIDHDYLPGHTYTYWVEVLWKDGTTLMLEPTSVTVPFRVFLPMVIQ